jgi:hypothetical protein
LQYFFELNNYVVIFYKENNNKFFLNLNFAILFTLYREINNFGFTDLNKSLLIFLSIRLNNLTKQINLNHKSYLTVTILIFPTLAKLNKARKKILEFIENFKLNKDFFVFIFPELHKCILKYH